MNVTPEQMEQIHYADRLRMLQVFAGCLFGGKTPEALYVCDTFQFSDYAKYDATLFDPAHKEQVRRDRFPADCQRAFELGLRIASSAAL